MFVESQNDRSPIFTGRLICCEAPGASTLVFAKPQAAWPAVDAETVNGVAA